MDNGASTIITAIALLLLLLLGVFGWSIYNLIYSPQARLKRRIAGISAGTAVTKGKQVRVGRAIKRRNIQRSLKQIDESRAKKRSSRMRDELMQAGLRIEVSHYLLGSAGLGLLAALIYATTSLPRIGIVLAPLIVGFGLPRMVVGIMAKRRLKQFTALFADSLDIIIRGIRSGLPLGECISIIGREMGEPVGSEFRLIAEGQKLGLTLQDALERAVDRMPSQDFRFFAIVLTIQQQTGGNLAETLQKLSDVLRARKRMRDKIQAYSSEAKASAGIIGSLPIAVSTLLSIVAPKYIGILFTTDPGHMVIAIGLTVMSVGVLVMRKMINFDI